MACLAAGPVAVAAPAAPSAVDEERHAAVAAARRGDTDGAAMRLEALLAAHPDDRALALDVAVVAAWRGDDERTMALLRPIPTAELPDYVLEAFAKSARNLKRWPEALDLYRTLQDRQPDRLQPRIGRVLVLADMDRFDPALGQLDQARRELRLDPRELADTYFACGYVQERARRLTRALACYDQALELAPDHTDARRRRILTASALGATHQALAAVRDDPTLLSASERQRLALDAAAMEVRWAGLPDPETPRIHARNALTAQDSLLTEPDLAQVGTARARSLRYDRVAALAADFRMGEAVAEFEALRAGSELSALPLYALEAAGQAYLYLERPAQAAEVFRAGLQQAPQDISAQIGLFYALSDLQRHDEARGVVTRMLAERPAWRHPTPAAWIAVPEHARAREAQALELAFRDDYDAALGNFDRMLEVAPANTSLRLSRAQVRRWRGWYQAAGSDVGRARTLEPDSSRARMLGAHLDLDTHRYRRAEQTVAVAVAQAPDARATLELVERWRVHSSPELIVDGSVGRSDGGAFSSRDWRLDTRYYSAPLAYQYRAFVHDVVSYGRFDEGSGRDHRLGAGMEYRRPHWTASAEVFQGLADNDGTGAGAELAWLPDDHWRAGLRAYLNSPDVPLRGTRIGLEGDQVELGGGYRWHEARDASATLGLLDMDDGNARQWLQLGYRQRIMNQPTHKLFASARAYGSRNSERDRVYYNPEADRELSVGLTHEWRLFRRYDRGLVQRLGIEAGDYWQDGYGNGSIWTISAEHDWQLGPRVSAHYGLRTGGRIYDGDREHVAAVYGGLEWRL